MRGARARRRDDGGIPRLVALASVGQTGEWVLEGEGAGMLLGSHAPAGLLFLFVIASQGEDQQPYAENASQAQCLVQFDRLLMSRDAVLVRIDVEFER